VVLGGVLNGGATLHLQAGNNVNSIKLVSNSTLVVDAPPVGPVGPVTLNVADSTTTPLDLVAARSEPAPAGELRDLTLPRTAGSWRAWSSGTGEPRRSRVQLVGGSDFYGEILGATVSDTGGTHFHYDRSLKKKGFAPSNPMMSAFTWRKQ
jgi:hypothetical protein